MHRLHSFLEELARSMAAMTVRFLEGSGSWLLGHWQQKIPNSEGELVVSCRDLSNRNCAILGGNW